MAGKYAQAKRGMEVTTPLGSDALLLVGLTGREGMSQLFDFQLDVLAENKQKVDFGAILGQGVTVRVELEGGKQRYLNGICNRMSQGKQDETFTSYRMDIVPKFWLWTKKAQSRIFQQKTVPDILKDVLKGIDFRNEIQGTFEPRDYCVQYRETDFNFVTRLMEEEGIFYFFEHSDGSHKMVLANSPTSLNDLKDESKLLYEALEGGGRDEFRVYEWEKAQELRSGKCTLWDYHFEKPDAHLEAEEPILSSISAGTVEHKLKVGGNENFELYDFPGEYAQRFDGIDKGGGEQPGEVQKIFEDNKRTVKLRMQQEAIAGLVIQGRSNHRHLSTGNKFTLERHFNADGEYLLVSVQHHGRLSGDFRSGGATTFEYSNVFTCIPSALPFRPVRQASKPFVQGTQTAHVVGPSGQEIFTDKFARVKVQFNWDRQGKKDANSSCWVRVGSIWAGKNWGAIHIPRIGQEVIVAFEEGDPDQPIIIGSVYNAANMPPYKLPDNKTQSGLKSRSSLNGTPDHFNELRFEDLKDSEDIYFHAQKDFHRVVENDDDLKVGRDQTIEIKRHRTEVVKEGNEKVTVEKGNRDVEISKGNETLLIGEGNQKTTLKKGDQTTEVSKGLIMTKAKKSIELKVGKSSIKMTPDKITIKSLQIEVNGTVQTEVKGLTTTVKGTTALNLSGGVINIG